jgi:hypothetical protein
MDTFGFILTRHVNSARTNQYWNHCVQCIRRLYPQNRIVIIDDNSNEEFLQSEKEYENVTIVESKFKKRGELLPYYYLLKEKYFPYAVILHDSVFFHKRLNFEKLLHINVIPLWHFPADKENALNSLQISTHLTNRFSVQSKLMLTDNILGMSHHNWSGCFGCQCFISLNFLNYLESKYHITNMIELVKCRKDRCCLERIFGVIFYTENAKQLSINRSLFGRIHNHYAAFKYNYEKYLADLGKNLTRGKVVKVWTGR